MFRFTIRDALWLMVVVGLAIGWRLQAGRLRAVLNDHDHRIEEINSSGAWMDQKGRVLQLWKDAQGRYDIVPYEKDERGNWGPAPGHRSR